MDGKFVQVAAFSDGCVVEWSRDDLVKEEVREAMDAFMDDLE